MSGHPLDPLTRPDAARALPVAASVMPHSGNNRAGKSAGIGVREPSVPAYPLGRPDRLIQRDIPQYQPMPASAPQVMRMTAGAPSVGVVHQNMLAVHRRLKRTEAKISEVFGDI